MAAHTAARIKTEQTLIDVNAALGATRTVTYSELSAILLDVSWWRTRATPTVFVAKDGLLAEVFTAGLPPHIRAVRSKCTPGVAIIWHHTAGGQSADCLYRCGRHFLHIDFALGSDGKWHKRNVVYMLTEEPKIQDMPPAIYKMLPFAAPMSAPVSAPVSAPMSVPMSAPTLSSPTSKLRHDARAFIPSVSAQRGHLIN